MLKIFSKITSFLLASKAISLRSEKMMILELFKLVQYKIVTGYGPDMYLLYSLYEKNMSEWQQFIGKKEMCELLRQVNEPSDMVTLNDKVEFYIFCKNNQLPSPEVLFTIGAGKNYFNLTDVSDLEYFQTIFEKLGFGYYIFKPAVGSYGGGIYSFLLDHQGFVDLQSGIILSEAEIFKKFFDMGICYLIQNTLVPTPQLKKIMPFPACGMVRVVSYLNKNGKVSIPYAFVTIPSEGQIVSNFMHGYSGNLLAAIDVKSGELLKGFRFGSDNLIASFVLHPDTKEKIEGLEISVWDEVLDIAEIAARSLDTIRFVGWDIAITDTGVKVLEGNPMCDPDGLQLTLEKGIKEALVSQLKC
jgi:hypothetical protein